MEYKIINKFNKFIANLLRFKNEQMYLLSLPYFSNLLKRREMRDKYTNSNDKSQMSKLIQLMKHLGVSEDFPNYSDLNYWNNRYTKEKSETTAW